MKRGAVAFMLIALLLSACQKKSVVPPTPTPSPSPSPTGTLATSVSVELTYQGTVQAGVTIIESSGYNFTNNTPTGTLASGITGTSGTVTLAIGTPTSPYCFSAHYTPSGGSAAIDVANCQPSLVGISTITLGN
ncbi:MAG: hypothetical protein NVS9B12_04570 [Vulcanimicrobiaceae bacterium]